MTGAVLLHREKLTSGRKYLWENKRGMEVS